MTIAEVAAERAKKTNGKTMANLMSFPGILIRLISMSNTKKVIGKIQAIKLT